MQEKQGVQKMLIKVKKGQQVYTGAHGIFWSAYLCYRAYEQ